MLTLPFAKPLLQQCTTFVSAIRRRILWQMGSTQTMSSLTEDPEMKHFIDYIDSLKNFEKSGVPTGAGTDSRDGFDLGRMTRLMERFGNPHSSFKVRLLSAHFFLMPKLDCCVLGCSDRSSFFFLNLFLL